MAIVSLIFNGKDLIPNPENSRSFYVLDDSLIIENFIQGNGKLPNNFQQFVDDANIRTDVKRIIFDQSGHGYDSHASLINIDKFFFNKPVYILSSNFQYYKKSLDDRIIFFPYWHIWSSLEKPNFYDNDRSYVLSCLNANPWNHRVLTYLGLAKKSYFNKILFTWKGKLYSQDMGIDCISDVTLSEEELAEYNLLPNKILFNDEENNILDTGCDHPAYKSSYVNLVTETYSKINVNLLSEKTFKPIRSGQLFILIGSPGSISHLRDIGFDTFDDIIDHSYDDILDDRARIAAALKQVDYLFDLDLKEIFVKIKPRLKKNFEFLISEEFRGQFLPLRFSNE